MPAYSASNAASSVSPSIYSKCFAIGKAHSRAWYSAGLSDGRRDEHDGRNQHNKNQHELPALHHGGET